VGGYCFILQPQAFAYHKGAEENYVKIFQSIFSSYLATLQNQSQSNDLKPPRHVELNMATCRICEQALVIELDADSFDESAASSSVGSVVTAPDDLLLPCGDHFHWSVPQILFLLPLLKHLSSMGTLKLKTSSEA
jgi:hypothetical protein